ncbi:MAG: hypothetical protein FJZ86_18760 [Chloroflexi bacterium]|nr:hypothetical protein [Chloroflexota bacterium]
MSTDTREYAERFYEFKGHPLVEGNGITKDIWDTWEAKAFDVMRADLNSGWEVDPSNWGAHCLKYEKKRINLLSRNAGAWVIYIILSIVTYGIGFFIVPFFMNRDFLEIRGFEVRLQKIK